MNRQRTLIIYVVLACLCLLSCTTGAGLSALHYRAEAGSVAFLQREVVSLHSQLNKSQSTIAAKCSVYP